MKIIDEERRENIFSLIKKYVKDDLILIKPLAIDLKEDISNGLCNVKVSFLENNKRKSIKSEGSGVVESIFDAYMRHYSEIYKSLKTIEFTGFQVKTNPKSFGSPGSLGANAHCEVRISLKNTSRNNMLFFGRSRSLSGASTEAVSDAYEYYINAEKCFVKMKNSLLDAKNRNRGDIVNRITYDMTEVVSVTNYDYLEVL
tara:strand:+ start:962 stop:1561 length:600 start_codon:yes stop_codon:yes gene_type:complete